MRLREFMTTDVKAVPASMPAERAWNLMQSLRFHHLVVLEGREVAGIVSDRDLGGARGRSTRNGRSVADLMTSQVVTAAPDTTVRAAANLLRGRAIGCLPVMQDGKLAGIVTVSDMLELVGRGAERPVARSTRWTLKHRGPRRRQASQGR